MSSKSWRAACGNMPMPHLRLQLSVTLCALWLGLLCLGSPAADGWAAASDDAFVAGYATAVLEREFNLHAPSLRVTDGLVTVTAEDLAGADREEVLRRLSSIRGVLRVVVQSADPASSDAAATIVMQPPAADRGPGNVGSMSDPLPVGWLPEGHLFSPLLADPRWPHFSASYQYYPNDQNVQKRWRSHVRGDLSPLQDGRADDRDRWSWASRQGCLRFSIWRPSRWTS